MEKPYVKMETYFIKSYILVSVDDPLGQIRAKLVADRPRLSL